MYSGKRCSIPESDSIWPKVFVFGQKWLYSGKLVVFRQSGCIRISWWYLGKSGYIRANKDVFRQKGFFFGHKPLNSGKLVVFAQSGCVRAEVVVFGQKRLLSGKTGCIRDKSGCIRANWLYSVKSGFIRAKMVVSGEGGCIRAKWLYSRKVVVFGQKLC